MAKKSKGNRSKIALAVAAVAAGTLLLIKTPAGQIFKAPAYKVAHVSDGDTFETSEQAGIRLALVDAPDKGNCGYQESKETLEKLVLNKPIYMKILVKDRYGRLVALVYNPDGLVNAQMVEKGQAYYRKKEKVSDDIVSQMKVANLKARAKEIGIFSSKCTQLENPSNPKCNIKGNASNGNKYLIPGCHAYTSTVVQKYLGDKWFCTETEARDAGFVKAGQCP